MNSIDFSLNGSRVDIKAQPSEKKTFTDSRAVESININKNPSINWRLAESSKLKNSQSQASISHQNFASPTFSKREWSDQHSNTLANFHPLRETQPAKILNQSQQNFYPPQGNLAMMRKPEPHNGFVQQLPKQF